MKKYVNTYLKQCKYNIFFAFLQFFYPFNEIF